MSPKEVNEHLTKYEAILFALENRISIELDTNWTKKIPLGAGVYVIFDGQNPVYVGETGSLRRRMKDLRDTRNHSLRRSIGAEKFSDLKGYEKATAKRKYAPHIEKLVVEFIRKMEVQLIQVDFGRKEIEEYVIKKHNPIYNLRAKRG